MLLRIDMKVAVQTYHSYSDPLIMLEMRKSPCQAEQQKLLDCLKYKVFFIIFFSFFSLLTRRYSPCSLFEDTLGNASHNMIIIIADSNIFLKCMLNEKNIFKRTTFVLRTRLFVPYKGEIAASFN